MRIIFHLGLPKTGSTALQSALNKMRGNLGEEGFHYPVGFGRRPEFHHILAGLLGDRGAIPPILGKQFPSDADAENQARKFAFQAVSTARSNGNHTVVFSTEHMMFKDVRGSIKNLGYLNEIADRVETVYYVREPASLYASSVSEVAKRGRFYKPFQATYLRQHAEELEMTFGVKPIIRGYAKELLLNGDICVDFFQHVLKSELSPLSFQSNIAMSLEAASLLITIRELAERGGQASDLNKVRRIFQRIRHIDFQHSGPLTYDIKPELAREIRSSATEYAWLSEEHGIDFPEIDYANISDVSNQLGNKYKTISDVADIKVHQAAELLLKAIGAADEKGLIRLLRRNR